MQSVYHLYLDDSGTRFPNHQQLPRLDRLDYFALGGWLILANCVDDAREAHAALTVRYELSAPLHSNAIRVRKGAFGWLRKEAARACAFQNDLAHALGELPGYVLGCVIHRPGYNARYSPLYGERRWDLCKSAYPIVVERAAKFAARSQSRLMVYLEKTGAREDRAIREYHKNLLTKGMYFDPENSQKYAPLSANSFVDTLFAKPHFLTKDHPMAQFADLVVYAIAKGRYKPSYKPYRSLWDAGKIIDTALLPSEAPQLGLKYYCFDGL
jgi:hypothetical protein